MPLDALADNDPAQPKQGAVAAARAAWNHPVRESRAASLAAKGDGKGAAVGSGRIEAEHTAADFPKAAQPDSLCQTEQGARGARGADLRAEAGPQWIQC